MPWTGIPNHKTQGMRCECIFLTDWAMVELDEKCLKYIILENAVGYSQKYRSRK